MILVLFHFLLLFFFSLFILLYFLFVPVFFFHCIRFHIHLSLYFLLLFPFFSVFLEPTFLVVRFPICPLLVRPFFHIILYSCFSSFSFFHFCLFPNINIFYINQISSNSLPFFVCCSSYFFLAYYFPILPFCSSFLISLLFSSFTFNTLILFRFPIFPYFCYSFCSSFSHSPPYYTFSCSFSCEINKLHVCRNLTRQRKTEKKMQIRTQNIK